VRRKNLKKKNKTILTELLQREGGSYMSSKACRGNFGATGKNWHYAPY
jgi:hypothetical protein